jgi:hypothetical protein
MPRYTPNVGKWHLRAVTLLVTLMIAGGQTVIVLCNALCATHSHTTTAATTHSDVVPNAHHHHPLDNQVPASRHDRDINAGSTDHTHEQAAVSAADTSPDLPSLNLASEDCCSGLGFGPATMAPVRADKSVLIASYVPESIEAIALDLLHRQHGLATHAAPPGELSLARIPLPLRI